MYYTPEEQVRFLRHNPFKDSRQDFYILNYQDYIVFIRNDKPGYIDLVEKGFSFRERFGIKRDCNLFGEWLNSIAPYLEWERKVTSLKRLKERYLNEKNI